MKGHAIEAYYQPTWFSRIAALLGWVGARLYRGITPATSGATAAEHTLQTYTLPANALHSDGMSVVIEASGSFAANGQNKTVKLCLGALEFSSGVVTHNDKKWFARLEVIRTGAATQQYRGRFSSDGTADVIGNSTGTVDLTAAAAITVKGTNGSASADITCTNMTVDLK